MLPGPHGQSSTMGPADSEGKRNQAVVGRVAAPPERATLIDGVDGEFDGDRGGRCGGRGLGEERAEGQLEIARGHFEEGRNIFRLLGHKGFETAMTSEIGHIARMKGDISQAKEIYRQTILSFQELGNRPAVAHQLECFGIIAVAEADSPRAGKLLGAAETLRERIESPMTDFERNEYDQAVARLRALLPEAEFKTLWAEGRSLTREQAIRLALS